MDVVDLSSRKVGSLPLTFGGRTYMARPPSAKVGELLMKILNLGVKAAVAPEEMTHALVMETLGADTVEELGAESEDSIDQLSLGVDTWQQMREDSLPSEDIHTAARYAAFFWVFGKEAADQIVLQDNGQDTGVKDEPAFPKPWQSGPSTGDQELKTPTEHSPDTISPQKSAPSSTKGKTRRKKAESPSAS